MSLIGTEQATALGRASFSSGEIDHMKEMLDDPNVSAEDKNVILYGLSTMGHLSDSEIRSQAARLPGVDAEDCIDGGRAPMENITNLVDTYSAVAERQARRAKQQIENAQEAIRQGGYSNSDQIVDQGVKGLELFDQFYPYYKRAGGQQSGGPRSHGSGESIEPATPLQTSAPEGGDGGRGYTHSGRAPESLRKGMDEFRNIDFSAFRADAEILKEAHGTVDQSTEQLHAAWGKSAGDWTGDAKAVAQRRNNNLTNGAGDLLQALKTAPDNIESVIDDGVQKNVSNFGQRVLELYGDGTMAEMTPQEVSSAVKATERLPHLIEDLESKIKEMESQGILEKVFDFVVPFAFPFLIPSVIGVNIAENLTEGNIREETEKLKQGLQEAQRKLQQFCRAYEKKADSFHDHARTYVKAIHKNYSALIDTLGKALDPPPFSEPEKGDTSAGQAQGRRDAGSGLGGYGTGSGGTAGATGASMPAGAGAASGGSAADTSSMSEPSSAQEEQESGMNPVTGRPLAKDAETGEPYPIDPETGEPLRDRGDQRESLTVRHGDEELNMVEPNADGDMTITLDDGSGEPLNFELAFAAGDEAQGVDADSTGDDQRERAVTSGNRDHDPGDGESSGDQMREAGKKVYRPDEDGRIHIEKDGVEITAARPDGPDGPTVVAVDDGSAEPTTYTLGEQDARQAEPEVADTDELSSADQLSEPGEAAEAGSDRATRSNLGTAAQGWFGDVFGGESGIDAGANALNDSAGLGGEAAPETAPESAAGSSAGTAGLGAAPGGGTTAGASDQSAGGSGSTGAVGMMGAGLGNTGESEQEQVSGGYEVDEELFASGGDVRRISGSLDSPEDGYHYVRTER